MSRRRRSACAIRPAVTVTGVAVGLRGAVDTVVAVGLPLALTVVAIGIHRRGYRPTGSRNHCGYRPTGSRPTSRRHCRG